MKHDSQARYKSTLAFTDLLFNILIGFAFLFIIAFILINPITEEASVEAKAEFMVIMEWEDKSHYDVDLWMQDAMGTIVGFPNKEAGWLHLDRDDLGRSNDTIVLANGERRTLYLNREIMTVRGNSSGEHIVNVHLYSTKNRNDGPIDVNVQVLKINPYSEVHNDVITLKNNRDERTVIRFVVDEKGEVVSKNRLQKRFAGKQAANIQPGGSTSDTNISNLPPPSNYPTLQGPESNQVEESTRSTYTISSDGEVQRREDGPAGGYEIEHDTGNDQEADDYERGGW